MARWDSLRKKKRNLAIRVCHKEQPDLSMAEIAEIFNISRQRVHKILKHSEMEAE